jgi:hypothetical protein
LTVDGDTGATKEAYLRFVVSGVSGVIDQATLRLTVGSSSGAATRDGPAVFTAGNEWTETGLNWSNRPARSTTPTEDKGALASNEVVDFDVTSLVTGNGTVTFVLAGPSADGAVFNSRDSSDGQPQLLLSVRGSGGSATVTPTPTATATATATATSTAESSTLTIAPDADAEVREAEPTTNHGTSRALTVDGDTGANKEAYLRFTVDGVTGFVQHATLRLTVGSSSGAATGDGPAVFTGGNDWTEMGLTWNNRPTRSATPIDDTDGLASNAAADYDVTTFVTGNGT